MRRSILVVDDEKGIRLTFESFLSDAGYEVCAVSSYDEALARISEEDFDLVFTDIILYDKTGIDVLREVRERNPNCPVVMVTGYPNLETASEAVRLGAFDYLPKPVVQQTLLRVARQALQHKELADEKESYRLNLEAIFRSVGEAIITVNKDLVVVELNEAARTICGLTRDHVGKAFTAAVQNCDGRCSEVLAEAIEKRKPAELYRVECRYKGRPSQVVTLNSYPLISHQGKITGGIMVVRDETRLANLERDLARRERYHQIVGRNEKMQKIYSLIEALSETQTTVLVTGESGTGKELVAEAIHYAGARKDKPLVKVHCPALAENLLESELFGHVKGAFTGAIKDKVGRFELAHGGSIFLDEIGDISKKVQLKLLRVLQEREFERVGDTTPIRVDVRVIAATNRDLKKNVEEGQFREDLYYRLKVVEVKLPPLRERREDIPLLVDHFIKRFNEKFGRDISGISTEVQGLFTEYGWPGNIRELEHAIEHAFVLCRQPVITLSDVPQELKDFTGAPVSTPAKEREDPSQAIIDALKKAGWNKVKAAQLLGMSRSTLYRKIEEYGIKGEDSSL